jgi:hypothetical protein
MDELKSADRRLERNENLLRKKHIDAFAAWLDDKVGIHIKKVNVYLCY